MGSTSANSSTPSRSRHSKDAERGSSYDEDRANPFSNQNIRRQFISKVYGILAFQLAVTFVICAFIVFHEPTHMFLAANQWLMWILMGIYMITTFVLICFQSVARAVPCNYILLGVVTFCLSTSTGFICAFTAPKAVFTAVGITLAAVILVSLFSCFTSFDFTKLIWIAIILAVILFIGGIVGCFWKNNKFQLVYAVIVAIVMILYLAIDTQMILGGRKYELSPEDYVYGTLRLYIDIMQLFLYVLEIIARSSGKS